jgi:hypothetical protein
MHLENAALVQCLLDNRMALLRFVESLEHSLYTGSIDVQGVCFKGDPDICKKIHKAVLDTTKECIKELEEQLIDL